MNSAPSWGGTLPQLASAALILPCTFSQLYTPIPIASIIAHQRRRRNLESHLIEEDAASFQDKAGTQTCRAKKPRLKLFLQYITYASTEKGRKSFGNFADEKILKDLKNRFNVYNRAIIDNIPTDFNNGTPFHQSLMCSTAMLY